ncbi:MAG: DUF3052 family protein [Bauldia sp.]|nr:DUF3052 family protein [Bauldia sp.]
MNEPSAVGYSGTPLPKKLGFKDGQTALFVNLPDDLAWLIGSVGFVTAERADAVKVARERYDVIHAFFTSAADLAAAAPKMIAAIRPDGMIWVSWPKKAAKVATDITEDEIRRIVLPIGLVDVKVCAVSAVWSGLKLVIRKALRPA